MKRNIHPPRLASLFLQSILPRDIRDQVLGDLAEKHAELAAASETSQARRWFWRQTPASIAPVLRPGRGAGRAQSDHARAGRSASATGLSNMLLSCLTDLRFALRWARLNPGFTAIVVLTLALGIGANTAIFSVVNGVLLHPLPYEDAERIVRIWNGDAENRQYRNPISSGEIVAYLDDDRLGEVFESIAGFTLDFVNLSGGDEPLQVSAAYVMHDFFDVFGVAAADGRTFLPEEDAAGADAVVVISHGVWRRLLGGAPEAVGALLQVDGAKRTIVGIMPAGFDYFPGTDVWLPLALDPASTPPPNFLSHSSSIAGKLRPETGIEQATKRIDAVVAGVLADHPEHDGTHVARVQPLRDVMVGSMRPTLMARAESRQREVALRFALGAGRGRVVRQLLVESTLFALLGGAFGLIVTSVTFDGLMALVPGSMPRSAEIQLDGNILVFALAITLATGLLFGLVPALGAGRTSLARSLGGSDRGSTHSAAAGRYRGGLAVAEVALVFVLMSGAGLMARSFWRLTRVDLGIKTQRLLTFNVFVPAARYPANDDVTGFFERLVGDVAALPGVESAGAVSWLPLIRFPSNWGVQVEGREPDPDLPGPDYANVMGDYFEAVGLPLLGGRRFLPEDAVAAPAVIVTETMARLYWPDEEVLGKRLLMNTDTTWRTVVGVVGDHLNRGPGVPPRPGIYLPHIEVQTGGPWLDRDLGIAIRTSGDPLALAAAARQRVWTIDPDLPINGLQTMETAVAGIVSQPRFTLLLLAAFAAVGLLLGAVGVYGVVAYSVAQRTREFGIRLALGAARGEVLRLVVRSSMARVGAGVVLGLLLAFWAARALMATLLFEVTPHDPATLVAVGLLVLTVGLIASCMPAYRATRVDPITALRLE